ncbi:DNA repair protein recO [Candidatus Moduliflexus flocculans]|uniref:DNA repair protein RecO n=1 Tax=Candidatus Moduliflexus flocculans TaxID=1499966 RepID=A0A081BMG1_9BACT|nr:DNA repair protein recO [Candidatus Moduliflexus flocculans]
MSFKKTEAVVIKTTNLREADKIITFFSRDFGKIQGIARGVRKIHSRYSGKLELFTRLNVIFFQKIEPLATVDHHPLFSITQADVVEVFPALQADFNKLIGASYIAEFLNRVFEVHDDSQPQVYPLVCKTLRAIADAQQIRPILPAFELKLLTHLGYTPELNRCTNCQKSRAKLLETPSTAQQMPGFSFATGGFLCPSCRPLKKEAVETTYQALDLLQALLETDISHVEQLPCSLSIHQEIKQLLTNYLQFHLGLSLKTDTFVQKIRSAASPQ